jgi:SAM-dependent methyltransferase
MSLMEVQDFVLSHVPHPRSRILEVGCGSGELAVAIAKRGNDVTAIDPDAPNGPIFRKVSLEAFEAGGPFDAVVASRSLHHIEDLELAVDKIHAVLRPDGALILNEFAWDQMDEDTAGWYLAHVVHPSDKDATLLPENFPTAWIAEHEGLHTSTAMTDALRRRFQVQSFEWVPYMAEHYLKRDDLVMEERSLIESQKIKPIGFRYVGSRI